MWKKVDAGPSEPAAVSDEGDVYTAVYNGELSQSAAAKQLGIPRGTFRNRYFTWVREEAPKAKPQDIVVEYRPTESDAVAAVQRRNDELETENKVLKSLIMRAMRTA